MNTVCIEIENLYDCWATFTRILGLFKDFLKFFKDLLVNCGIFRYISSAKKIGRPILAYLPTYYVRFLSYHARPTYLPKIGRH